MVVWIEAIVPLYCWSSISIAIMRTQQLISRPFVNGPHLQFGKKPTVVEQMKFLLLGLQIFNKIFILLELFENELLSGHFYKLYGTQFVITYLEFFEL